MLQSKHVLVNGLCQVCRRGRNTVHVLITCPFAVQCWQLVIQEFQWTEIHELHQWWEQILSNYDNNKQAVVATVCWSLWKARNEMMWNKKETRAYVVIENAKQYLEQWNYAQNKLSVTRFPTLVEKDGDNVWLRPHELIIKISVDAATFSEYNS